MEESQGELHGRQCVYFICGFLVQVCSSCYQIFAFACNKNLPLFKQHYQLWPRQDYSQSGQVIVC